jgi:hypothetical protein
MIFDFAELVVYNGTCSHFSTGAFERSLVWSQILLSCQSKDAISRQLCTEVCNVQTQNFVLSLDIPLHIFNIATCVTDFHQTEFGMTKCVHPAFVAPSQMSLMTAIQYVFPNALCVRRYILLVTSIDPDRFVSLLRRQRRDGSDLSMATPNPLNELSNPAAFQIPLGCTPLERVKVQPLRDGSDSAAFEVPLG